MIIGLLWIILYLTSLSPSTWPQTGIRGLFELGFTAPKKNVARSVPVIQQQAALRLACFGSFSRNVCFRKFDRPVTCEPGSSEGAALRPIVRCCVLAAFRAKKTRGRRKMPCSCQWMQIRSLIYGAGRMDRCCCCCCCRRHGLATSAAELSRRAPAAAWPAMLKASCSALLQSTEFRGLESITLTLRFIAPLLAAGLRPPRPALGKRE